MMMTTQKRMGFPLLMGLVLMVVLGGGSAVADDTPEVFVPTRHVFNLDKFAILPDGQRLLSADLSSIMLWDMETGRQVRSFGDGAHRGSITGVAVSPDGRVALSGSSDQTLKLWELSTGREIRTLRGHTDDIISIAFSPDGRYALSGAWEKDSSLKLWDVTTGETVWTSPGHSGGVSAVAFSPDGRYAISSGKDKTLKYWGIASGALVRTVEEKTAGIVHSFSSNSRYALSLIGAKDWKVWEVATGREIYTFTDLLKRPASALAVSPNGRWLLRANSDEDSLSLLDTATGNEVRTFKGYTGKVWSVAFSPDSRYAFSGGQEGIPRRWQIEAGKEVRPFLAGKSLIDLDVSFSPDGQYVLVAGVGQNTLRLWEVATGRTIQTFSGHKGVFSPDGRLVLSGSTNTAKLWDTATGREIRTFYGHNGRVDDVAFSPDGQSALTGSTDDSLKLWDIETGREIRTFSSVNGLMRVGIFSAVTFSKDGQYVFIATSNNHVDWFIKIWEVGTGQEVRAFKSRKFLGFSPAGIMVTQGSNGSSVRLLDPITEQEVKRFNGHVGEMETVKFSSNGQWAISRSRDNNFKLWDVATGREVRTIRGQSEYKYPSALSSDGKWLLTSSNRGHVGTMLWSLSRGEPLAKRVTFQDGEWIMITPKGYFTASEGGGKNLNVRIGNQVYGMDNFFEQFYRPDVVAEMLQTGESDATVLARIGEKERVNLTQAVKQPPSVRIVSPKAGESFDKDEVDVQVHAVDQGGGVDEIRLYHNGKVVGTDTRDLKVTAKAPSNGLTKGYRVRLVEGANVFRAVALSTDRIESNPDELTIQLKAVGKAATLHLLLVGINEYKNSTLNLNYALPDAQGMLTFFTGAASNLFKEVRRHELYDKAATKEAILATLQDLRASAPQDVVVIYMAGHGDSLENVWYFIPWEVATPEREGVIKTQGISSVELKEEIAKIGAQKVLVLIDACKSGAAMVAFAGRGVEDRKALAQLARSTGVHVMAASTKDQLASEVKDLGHGVFTYTLLEGLNGKADGSPEDGRVTVRELLSYVDSRLPELSEKYKQQAQYPVVDSRGQDFPLATVR